MAGAAGIRRRIGVQFRGHDGRGSGDLRQKMGLRILRLVYALICVATVGLAALPAAAQSGPAKPEQKQPAANGKDAQKQVDDLAEAARVLKGAAGNPECVWLGTRVVQLLWREDLDTAFRHLDLYDRFACPGAHIQASFRCLIRQGDIDPKQQETLKRRAYACWIDPGMAPPPPPTPAASAPAAAAPPPTKK